MGVVYAARQESLDRLVAVKCLAAEWILNQHLRERFQREAEAVARLNHPHIVQVYEIRCWEDRSYLIQEYVPGGNLAHFLAGKPQEPRGAALLTETLARAMAHVHAQGLVHRDLKPVNILLAEPLAETTPSPDGGPLCRLVPKIADFGLAKPVETDSGLTRQGNVVGTPNYMAPEQALGETVGPAADTYALGAMLYEMLTGRPPFVGTTSQETLNQVCEVEPVSPRRLQPAVPRDLETICLKCLQKLPNRRYLSALALADDLRRFLDREPILARPVGRVARLGKWVRRKPALAALALVAVAALVTLVVGVLWHNELLQAEVARANAKEAEARREKERAHERYRQARQTLESMLQHLENRKLADTPQVLELKKQQREEALKYYEAMVREGGEVDPEIQHDTARAAKAASRLQTDFGQHAAAEIQIRRAIGLYERLLQQQPNSLEYRDGLAACHNNLGTTLHHLNQIPEAEQHLRRSLAMREALSQTFPDHPVAWRGVAESHVTLGAFYFMQGQQYDRAKQHFRLAIGPLERLYAQAPERDVSLRLARAQLNLALMQPSSGTPETQAEQQRLNDAAQVVLENVLRENPADVEAACILSPLYVNRGLLDQKDQRWEPALAKFGRAIALMTPLHQREPNHALIRNRLAMAHGARGHLLAFILQRASEGIVDIERQIQVLSGPDQEFARLFLADAQVMAGQHARAFAEVEAVKDLASQRRYNHQLHLAIVCGKAMAAAEKDAALPSPERDRLKALYGQRGMEILRQARFLLDPKDWPKERQDLQTNPAYAPATTLPGFQAFLAEK